MCAMRQAGEHPSCLVLRIEIVRIGGQVGLLAVKRDLQPPCRIGLIAKIRMSSVEINF